MFLFVSFSDNSQFYPPIYSTSTFILIGFLVITYILYFGTFEMRPNKVLSKAKREYV
jgi:hypothetical protein